MKCPKCGFNSFEYYDNCKKCSSDLIGFKQTYSVASMVLPFEAKDKLSAAFRSSESSSDQINDMAESHDDIFSFNLPDDLSATQAQSNDDPFNFNEPSDDMNQANISNSNVDAFADLLESSPQAEASPFAEAQTLTSPAPAATIETSSSSGPGEFDLESFSWDDTPAETSASETAETTDDFDSLFGDTKDNNLK